MTRITRKKDVSDSKTEKVAKSQSQTGTKTKKTVAKNASTPAKTKKVESTKTAKVEKSVKNPAIKPTKETAKKEKAPKLSPAKSAVPSSKKEIKITKPKKTATLQQNTLFPEIIEHNFTKAVADKISTLNDIYLSTDSRSIQNKCLNIYFSSSITRSRSVEVRVRETPDSEICEIWESQSGIKILCFHFSLTTH
jgi:outer membrane biosynthesis protein TonB